MFPNSRVNGKNHLKGESRWAQQRSEIQDKLRVFDTHFEIAEMRWINNTSS